MAKLFEKKSVSDHIELVFPAAAQKGDIVKFGSIMGLADYNTGAGALGSVDMGKCAAVFQALKADLTGAATVGADVYLTGAGALTATASGNTLLGTVVAVGSETFDFVRA
jgi:predicted RecA/RadA family phage recombinase